MLSWKFSKVTTGCGLFLALAITPLVGMAQTDTIGVRSARIEAHLTTNGTLQVKETITYNFGSRQMSGFTRRLWFPDDGDVTIKAVRRDGLPEQYRSTRAGNVLRIVTGTPEIPLTGTHTYRFNYTVKGVVAFGADGPQITWQAVSGSQVPSEDITITLTAPFEISQASCRLRETDRGCPVDRVANGVRAQLTDIPVNRSVVLRAELPHSTFGRKEGGGDENTGWLYLGIILGLLVLAGGSYGAHRYLANKSTSENETDPVSEHIDTLSS